MADPTRILHIVYEMSRGGMETCIMHFLRHADPKEFQLDFVVHSPNRGHYDDEIESAGSQIYRNPPPGRPLSHRRAFREVLRHHGPYDAVHSHDMVWGPLIKIAAQEGVPTRITHSHNDVRHTPSASILERLYCRRGLRLSCRFATHGLAVSSVAAEAYFGSQWQEDPRWQVLVSGREFSSFEQTVDRNEIRRRFGFAPDHRVVGHVGSLTRQKNHPFLFEVFRELSRERPEVRLLLIGEGRLRPELEALATEMGIAGKTVFAGLRANVPELLLGAIDVFVFPSLYEGLPGALVEAQAAGLPCVISDVVAPETDMIPELIQRRSLNEDPENWAKDLVEALSPDSGLDPAEALNRAHQSIFDITRNMQALGAIYRSRSKSSTRQGR